jgi:glycerol kinase
MGLDMSGYILSIDQGTTGTTALVLDATNFQIVAKENREFPQIFPKPSWVEHDLQDIWKTVESTVSSVLKSSRISPDQIKCIGITNQRETSCAFNRDGQQLHNAIVWQDRRTNLYCQDLKKKHGKLVKAKTGLPVDPYFSGSKFRWLLDNSEEVKQALKSDDLLFGNIDTYLLYQLTGQKSYKTDFTNASRTLLMELKTGKWDSELLQLFDIPKTSLPEVCDSIGEFGKTLGLSFLPDEIPITAMLGDQLAALFGQAGINAGDMKNTYGTGAFFLLNTGEEVVESSAGLMSTSAYSYRGKRKFALEGGVYIAGAAVQWLRDNLQVIPDSPSIEALAESIEDLSHMQRVQFFPFFSGLGSPYWNPDALGAIVGLSRDTTKAHIARACLEGISQSVTDLIDAVKTDYPGKVSELRVDGGASANNLLLQMQANFLNVKVIRPKVIETTGAGVAYAAAIGQGLCDFSTMQEKWLPDCEFHYQASPYYETKRKLWKETVNSLY